MTEKLMVKMSFYVPKFHHEKIRAIAKHRKVSMSRLVALVIDEELIRDAPFTCDLSLASEEAVEYAYVDEASKLLNYMNKLDKNMALDTMLLMRYHIGIPDKLIFLGAFQELLSKEMIESYKEKVPEGRAPVADDYFHYRVAGTGKDRSKKLMSKDAKDFAKFQKLKKKFEGVE